MNIRTIFAFDPYDTEEIRLEKFATFLVAGSCSLAGIVWSAMYYLFFGLGLTTALPLAFTILVGSSLIVSHISKNHRYAIYTQIICIIYITAFIQWNIGGVFDSGFVLAWAFLGPICALMFFPVKKSIIWFVLYLINLVITVAFNDFFTSHSQAVTESVRLIFFITNLSVASLVVFIFAGYYVAAAKREREKANKLLLNVLPKEIAPILQENGETIADSYESASVLFADMIGSTPLFTSMEPSKAVDWLNEVFSVFDRLVEKFGLEKIRTIGDNYMVASGVPTPRKDHAQVMAQLALEMVDGLKSIPARNGNKMEFRLGINSGPMVAGVIGKTKFHYDVWGDVVNTAARMESHGEAGKIQIGPGTYDLIKGEFICTPRGVIDVKGKGSMQTWFLEGSQSS
ncbi:MAG: adenylate/guanylate cyclase domain-containing protein [Anaerolineales bacterium]|nr:adenylate/guanylate cyclase domain-containing protein [Chloroflexota bacterium]MBL6982412.1 adenylate/guanylate cyclase domain-containing protein [Anaerolineales bacterium]